MTGIGAAMVGGNSRGRQADDWYPTPPEATVALLESPWRPLDWNRTGGKLPVWEPAAGDGAMAKVLRADGYQVETSDLRPKAEGIEELDFLQCFTLKADAIVTNPPFVLAESFIRHAHRLGAPYIAMLLKAQYWHTAGRLKLWHLHRPAAVLPLTWRLDFLAQGQPVMDCSWVVWDRRRTPTQTIYHPLQRPACVGTSDLFKETTP